MKKNKIVLITEYFYPSNRNDANLLLGISEKLNEISSGNFFVICTTDLKENEEVDFLKNKVSRLKNVNISNKNLFTRIIKFAFITTKLAFNALISIKKNDNVLITTNPAFLLPILVILKKTKKFNLTLIVYDVFPENLVPAGIISDNNKLYKFTKYIYDWAYSKTDNLIVLGSDMNNLVSKKTNSKESIYTIQNWCDINKVAPHNRNNNKILKNLGISNKTIFLFAGNFGRLQGIETLLEASTLVKSDQFILLFIGNGVYKEKIITHIKKNEKNNVFYAGEYPSSEQNEFLNACDVAIVSLNSDMYGLGVPSKTYYNMAAAKPILYIGHTDSEVANLVNNHDIGWVVQSGDKNMLASEIDRICDSSIDFQSLGKKSRKVVEKYYSKESILKKYDQIFGR